MSRFSKAWLKNKLSRHTLNIIASVFLCSSVFLSCKSKQKEEPIARVYDKYLYRADIVGVGKGAALPEDSIQAVRNYIDSWIRHNLMLRYAQDNLAEEEQKLNDQLRDYKESLLIYLYESQLVKEKIDTVVPDSLIMNYYEQNKETFDLKTGIAQVKYIILPVVSHVRLDSVRKWMKDTNPYNFPKLRSWCAENATRCSINDSAWYNKEEVGALFPVDQFNFDNAQFNKSYIEVGDSSYAYLIKFNDYRIKGGDAPIDFVHQQIYDIIMNQRKVEFINNIHKSIYDEAFGKNNFQMYAEDTTTKH